jgi:CRP/FNR family cyclic AMP-dependent transcriptional regulator
MSGKAQVAMMDEDQQEVVVDEPAHGDFFGFASMLAADGAPDDGVLRWKRRLAWRLGRDDIAELVMHSRWQAWTC